ncbi:MAG: arylsulfatase [Bacteroidota bacterium]
MLHRNLFFSIFILLFAIEGQGQSPENPNIIIIYVDDLGYGDIGVNGAIGVQTPWVNRLAANGINFTDAHCAAATCTPSRYALLTGTYAFRNNAGILPGDAPLIIDPESRTMPDMLKDAGYTTGVVGKWHLGLGKGEIDWNKRVAPGPKEVGFDYSFLIPATGDRTPTVFLENQEVVGLDPADPITVDYRNPIPGGYPLGSKHPEMLKQYADAQHLGAITNGISRIGYMKGGEAALWVDEDIPMVLSQKAKAFMQQHQDKPFFLFFSLHDIHQPRIAKVNFIESSTMGPRGDVIAQMDWCVGQIMQQLDSLRLTENTMVIFTSDNGPILDDGYLDYARELKGAHQPGGPYRGSKYSIYEAGTRIPTIVSWPGTISSGSNSALLSQVDLYASLAALVGQELQADDALDSENVLNVWLGKTQKGRVVLFEQAYAYAIRKGNYKYIHPKENATIPQWLINKFVDPGYSTTPMLFDLGADPGETTNIADQHRALVTEMSTILEQTLAGPTRK